ncbi:MAG: putative metal-binding motif-containing protein, partial [Flavobacterium sp.]
MGAKLHYSLFVMVLFVFSITDSIGQNIFSGEPVQWVGTPNGFSTSPYNSDYRTLGYRRVSTNVGNPSDGRGQWATTINVQNSGGNIQPSNMPGGGSGGWLLISGPSGNRFQNKWAFGGVGQAAVNSQNDIAHQGSTDMGLNMSTPGRYTFVMRDNGYNNTEVYIGYTSNDPVSVSRTAASYVNSQAVISISSSATPSSGERVFVRYRVGTNNFTSSTSIVQATGSGTNWTATLPAQSCGSTIFYYVFTSTRDLNQLNASSEQQRSLATLRYDDAFGANYSISTNAASASVLSGNSTICEGDSSNLQVQITGGISPFNVEISDGSSTFTVNNYISNSPIAVTPDASKSYSLVSVTGSDGCLSAALSGSAAVTVQIPTLWYADVDGDGFGDPDDSIESCDQPLGYVDNNLDCDDSDDSITVAQVWYLDNDNDGFGNDAISIVDCFQPFGYVAVGGDCDDTDATIYPGAPVICYDGIQQDCNLDETDGCPQITTQLLPNDCNSTLTSMTQTVRAAFATVPAGVSVNAYRFLVTNTATNEFREVTTSNRVFSMALTDIAEYNSAYTVEVALLLNAEWQPYGPACTLTTP